MKPGHWDQVREQVGRDRDVWGQMSEQDWAGLTYTKVNLQPSNSMETDPFQAFVESLEPEDAMQLRPEEWEQIAETQQEHFLQLLDLA